MYQVDPFLLYSAITVFGTVMQAVTGTEWIALKWKSANITNHDLQRALRASYEDALNSINFAFRQKAGFLDKFDKKRLHQEITVSFNDQFLNPFVTEKQLSAEEVRTLAANCPAYCKLLQSSVDTILPLTEISNISIEDLLMIGHNLKGADDLYQLNSKAGSELMEKIRLIEGVPELFYELLAYKGLLLGSIVFFFNERIKSDERVRSILMHSELQRIREEQNRQHHQQVALLEEALHSRTISFTTSLSPIKDNFSEVLSSLERVEIELAQNTKYLERIYDMLCQDRGLSEKERRQLKAGLSTTFNLHDKYDFDESKPIGYGSVAVVYKAVHKGLKQVRALKLLKPEHKDNPEIVERFLREATVLGDLNHHNIVRIYDAGGGGPDLNFYLEMEYVDGITLRKSIQTEVFQWDRDLRLIRQLGSAIQKMHEAGIIHRDLNPRNIMVDKNGSIKVMDFGVAKIIGVEGLTRDGQIVGTHDYMAPEQACGQRVDERADIYSFGMIVYEICTKRIPSVPPLPLRQYQLKVPEWFEEVIVKCLAQDKVDRYSSMKDLMNAIEAGSKQSTVAIKCDFHPKVESIGVCTSCGKKICQDCCNIISDKQYCHQCTELAIKPQSTEISAPYPQKSEKTKPMPKKALLKGRTKWWAISSISFICLLLIGFVIVNYAKPGVTTKSSNLGDNKTTPISQDEKFKVVRTQNPATPGLLNWKIETGDYISVIYLSNGLLYAVGTHGVYAIDTITGDLRWSFNKEGEAWTSEIIDGTIYTGRNDGLYALDALTGKQKSKFSTNSAVTRVDAQGDTIIMGTYDGIYALDIQTLNNKWRFPTTKKVTLPVIQTENAIYFIQGDWNDPPEYGKLYALNKLTGAPKWSFTTEKWHLIFTYENSVIYAGNNDGLYALDAESGKQLWKFSGTYVGEAHLYNNKVFTKEGGNIFALDHSTGRLIWEFTPQEEAYEGMTIHDGTIYFCSTNMIYAIDSNTGSIKRKYEAGTHARILEIDNSIMYMSTNQGIDALNITNWQPIWNFNSGNPKETNFTYQIVLSDTMAYTHDQKVIYAIFAGR